MEKTLGQAALLLALCIAAPAQATLYRCKPDRKLMCRDGQCQAEPEGSFEHAEQFNLQTDGPTLLACLWTDCYDGPAQMLRNEEGITAMGLLTGREPDPIAVTLSIDPAELHFSAWWQLGPHGATLDSGTCTIQD